MNHKLILAIDFDGTIADTSYPFIRGLRKDAKKVINSLALKGCYIIVWTCRCEEREIDAEKFLSRSGILFDQINNHHPVLIEKFKNNTRKISADLYIDDKCIGGLPSWNKIEKSVNKILKKIDLGEFTSILN